MSQWTAETFVPPRSGKRADRDVHRAVHLLVEERVPHVTGDSGVAADPELTERARALVGVERLEQVLLLRVGRGIDDPAALETEANPVDVATSIHTRELGERDRSLGRVLDGAAEELATGDVGAARVDLHPPARDAEAKIRALADDAHLLGGVEALGVVAHPLPLGVPVEQAGAVEELRELLSGEASVLRERRRRVLAADPRNLVREEALLGRPIRGLDCLRPLDGRRRGVTRVLGCLDDEERVDLAHQVLVERSWCREQLERSFPHPRAIGRRVPAGERELRERVGAAARNCALHLLEQRLPELRPEHEHLPPRLHTEAGADEQLGVLTVARIGHRRRR